MHILLHVKYNTIHLVFLTWYQSHYSVIFLAVLSLSVLLHSQHHFRRHISRCNPSPLNLQCLSAVILGFQTYSRHHWGIPHCKDHYSFHHILIPHTYLYYTLYLLYKRTLSYFITCEIQYYSFSIFNLVSESLLWPFLSSFISIGVTPFSTSLLSSQYSPQLLAVEPPMSLSCRPWVTNL